MTAIQLALENASETRDNITIHTYSLTTVNILTNRKIDLNQDLLDFDKTWRQYKSRDHRRPIE